MRIFIRRFAALLIVLAVMAAGLTAMAAEKTLDVTYVKITGDEFVADTFNGVEARYNLYGRTYYCSEFITRYYAQVYGLCIVQGSGRGRRNDHAHRAELELERAGGRQPPDRVPDERVQLLYAALRRGRGFDAARAADRQLLGS